MNVKFIDGPLKDQKLKIKPSHYFEYIDRSNNNRYVYVIKRNKKGESLIKNGNTLLTLQQ